MYHITKKTTSIAALKLRQFLNYAFDSLFKRKHSQLKS